MVQLFLLGIITLMGIKLLQLMLVLLGPVMLMVQLPLIKRLLILGRS